MSKNVNIVLVDDHSIVRNGLKSLLEFEDNISIIGEASDGQEAIQVVADLKPDIVIMDIRMPNMTGIEATKEITGLGLSSKVLILSMHDTEEYVLQSIECGAHGYLLKDSGKEDFIKAIDKIMDGGKYFSSDVSAIIVGGYLSKTNVPSSTIPSAKSQDLLSYGVTKRESQIIEQIKKGKSNAEIAEVLGKSIRTIETHRFNLMKKLGVKNIAELLSIVS